MPHLLVTQLQFTRSEFIRSLEGVSPEDAVRVVAPLNCLSWMVGHLASQEHAYWIMVAQGKNLYPELHKRVGTGQPPSQPDLEEMWTVWKTVAAAADEFLTQLTPSQLTTHMEYKGKPRPESIGTMLQRNIYHYWMHIGEILTIRSLLGHQGLGEFVGDMTSAAYRPE